MNLKVNTLTLSGSGYPENLRHIPDPPRQIYYAGSSPESWISQPKVAVIGSRKVSGYGREVTQKIVRELAAAGVIIVSGLAYGVDSIAHEAALAAGGTCVVVLTSLSTIYPAVHLGLAHQIIDNGGTLVSEYQPGADIFKSNFIARNRIVSGLSDMVLITEAALRSGTLSTARFALEQGKTVGAVPGNITSFNSQGANNLIKSGALPVTEAADIFFALGINPQKSNAENKFIGTETEAGLIKIINSGVTSQEELATQLGLNGAQIGSLLTTLELNGYIKPLGAGHWTTT